MSPDDPTDRPAEPPAAPRPSDALLCPTCGNAVDPRKTTQALHRAGRLMLFCSSGCLRDFMQAERASKAEKP